jgi:arginase
MVGHGAHCAASPPPCHNRAAFTIPDDRERDATVVDDGTARTCGSEVRPVTVIEAPSVLGLFPRGVETMPDALRAAGLLDRLAAEQLRVEPPPWVHGRDPDTSLNNAAAIASYAVDLAGTVGEVLDSDRFPLVVGGDCSIGFGPLLALARRGRYGLLFLDGHADFAHPDDESSGEAASMDLALAVGRGPDAFTIDGRRALIAEDDVAVLGYRVHTDGTDMCRGVHIDDTAITAVDLDECRRRGVAIATADALAVVARPDLDGFWVHIDADVLDDDVMPAVDYRNPGGLGWDELTEIVSTAIATGDAVGLHITIFNPALDADGSISARLVDFLTDVLG